MGEVPPHQACMLSEEEPLAGAALNGTCSLVEPENLPLIAAHPLEQANVLSAYQDVELPYVVQMTLVAS